MSLAIISDIHGSPRSYREHISPGMSDEMLREALTGQQADIFVGGHTHMQMFRRYQRSYVLNPGSVGMAMDQAWPFDENALSMPWAEYAIIDTASGTFNVELHKVRFDIQTFIDATLASGMTHAEWSTHLWSLT